MNEREAGGGIEPAVDRWLERVALFVVVVASTWFALAAAWEIAGPFDAGHDAASAYVGIAAVEMQRWGWAPLVRFVEGAPSTSDFYCHHPWATRWITAFLVQIFGAHDWVVRLGPVAMSAATPPLIFLAARRLWGTAAAALAAAAFTVTPIAVAFADFNNLEVPVMFGVALTIWAMIRFRETWRRRYLWGSLFALALSLNSDWSAFVFAGTVLGLGVLRGTLLARGWFEPLDQRRFWLWWGLAATVAVLVAVFYASMFARFGLLDDLLHMSRARSSGVATPLTEVLAARRYWIDLSFTPVGVLLGKLALPVFLVRVAFLRRDLEALPLAVLVMATVHYVVFKQGADVHVFWSHYFALYLAYAVGALVASAGELLQRIRSLRYSWGPRMAFVLGLVPVLAMAPDAGSTLAYARRTGKRFDDHWRLIHQDADKIAVARHLRLEIPEGQPVAIHRSAKYSWALEWAFRRPVQHVEHVSEAGPPLFLDARFAEPHWLNVLAARASVTAYGPFWVANGAEHPAPFEGYRLTRGEPVAWQRYLVNAHDPFFTVVPDPFLTWELRYHFEQTPNPAPTIAPTDGEQLRVAHNVALAAGDAEGAVHWRERLRKKLRPLVRGHVAGVTLLGYEWLSGVAPRLRIYVGAAGASAAPWRAEVTSVVRATFWSLVPPPTAVRQVGMPFALPSTRWKQGFIYAAESEIRELPGVEEYRVQLVGPDGVGELVPLFTL